MLEAENGSQQWCIMPDLATDDPNSFGPGP